MTAGQELSVGWLALTCFAAHNLEPWSPWRRIRLSGIQRLASPELRDLKCTSSAQRAHMNTETSLELFKLAKTGLARRS